MDNKDSCSFYNFSEKQLQALARKFKRKQKWYEESQVWEELSNRNLSKSSTYKGYYNHSLHCSKHKEEFEKLYGLKSSKTRLENAGILNKGYQLVESKVVGFGAVSCVVYKHKIECTALQKSYCVAEKVYPGSRAENARREASVYKSYGRYDGAVPVLYSYREGFAFISLFMEFIDGVFISKDEWQENLGMIVEKQWFLNDSKNPEAERVIDKLGIVKRCKRKIKSHVKSNKSSDAHKLLKLWNYVHDDVEKLLLDSIFVLSHGDLARQNVIFSGSLIKIIDWDKCSLEPLGSYYPCFDISSDRAKDSIIKAGFLHGVSIGEDDYDRIKLASLVTSITTFVKNNDINSALSAASSVVKLVKK